jgi:hypothetical protein
LVFERGSALLERELGVIVELRLERFEFSVAASVLGARVASSHRPLAAAILAAGSAVCPAPRCERVGNWTREAADPPAADWPMLG